jgi:hypothetical protein
MNESTRVRALCCECGNLRTVSAKYKAPRSDDNRSLECYDDPRGWRVTCTLKCSVCGTKTRHAMLRDACTVLHRDHAEMREAEMREYERVALIRRQAEMATNDELREEALRRIRNILTKLDPETLTLRECGDLLGLLNEMMDRRGGVL